MNLLILLLFGILSISHGIYEIPEYDPCALRVLLCDDFTKPLTPIDNSTLEMFETIGELNAVCDELTKFRICLKNAEIFCKEYSDLDVGFRLLNNRRLAFDLCVRASSHQHVYMMVEGCVNKYSHSVIEFCTDKAVERVGLEFDLGDYESECRFLGEIQYCHIAVVTDLCGTIAGNLLEKLVVFRGERDFMCSGYEKERMSNIEAFYATMDSYTEQYRNIVYQLETEHKPERVDASKKDFKRQQEVFVQDRSSSKFQLRISPSIDEDGTFDNEYTSDRERPFNSETFHRAEQEALHPLSDQTIDSATIPPKTGPCLRLFYEKPTGKVLTYENCVCKTKASFFLTGIRRDGKLHHFGCGEADVLWATSSPLKDITCAWMVNPAEPQRLAPCSILIGFSVMEGEFCPKKAQHGLSFNATLAVYETISDREAKRVAEIRVLSFVKHPSTVERSLKYFKKHAHDIRYWCSEQHEVNKYKESNWVHSASRIGLMPSDVNKNGIVNEKGSFSDQKYNFYSSGSAKYPIDTEIHFISSIDSNLENDFEVDDAYISPNYNENMNPLLSDEMVSGKNSEESFTLPPSKPSQSSQHLYRPYELFRPRLGEVLEVEDQVMWDEDLGIKDAEKGNPNLSFQDAIEDNYSTRLNAEEICPVLQENISELVDKLIRYSKENYVNIADPLDMIESKNYKKFPICEKDMVVPFSNDMWKFEDSENINIDNQQNKYEEIYVVTPSAEIEIHGGPDRTMFEDSEVQSLDEDSEVQSLDEDSENFNTENKIFTIVKVPQDSDKGLTLGKDVIKNPRSTKVYFLELMSNYQNNEHPFSYNFIDASTNPEVASEEEYSAKPENVFNRRSNQQYQIDIEEILFDAFEVLAEVQINVRRMRKMQRETRKEENSKFQSLTKTEL